MYRTTQDILRQLRHEENLRIMEEIISEAEKQGKWLMSNYQKLIFSPDRLRELNAEGRFIWANKGNWDYIDPQIKEEHAQDH